MASVLLVPDNEGEDKHVESRLVPRLDESSNLSSSTRATVIRWLFLFLIGLGLKCVIAALFLVWHDIQGTNDGIVPSFCTDQAFSS